MALNSLELFLNQLKDSNESLRIQTAQVVFDIMMVHEGDLLANATVGVGHTRILNRFSLTMFVG